MNAALFIAYNGDENRPVPGSAIVEYCGLHKRALEPVLQKISNAEFIISVKGAKGGYYMPRPEKVSLADIARLFIEDIIPPKHDFSAYGDILEEDLLKSFQAWLDQLSKAPFSKLCDKAKDNDISTLSKPVLNFSI